MTREYQITIWKKKGNTNLAVPSTRHYNILICDIYPIDLNQLRQTQSNFNT